MKLLYLHQYFSTRSGSTGTRSYEMARRWASRGHEIHVITSARGEGEKFSGWRVDEVDGFTVHWIWVPYDNKMGFFRRIKAFLRYAVAAGTRASAVGGDCLFVTSTPLTILVPGLYARWRLGLPFVFEVRDLWPTLPIAIGALRNPLLKRAAYWLERKGYESADRVVVLSPDMVQHVVESGCASERIVVAPNSCDVDLFSSAKDRGAEFRKQYPFLKRPYLVIYAGTLGKINGVDYLADMAAEVQNNSDDIDFLIVGDGGEKDYVETYAARRGVLNKNLWMKPPLPKTELVAALGAASLACSLFVDLEEMWANSANKFFDALAAGLPVLINYGGWQKELLQKTGAGLVVPPKDAAKAAAALSNFLHDSAQADAARRAAQTLAIAEFDRDRISQRVLDSIEQVVQES